MAQTVTRTIYLDRNENEYSTLEDAEIADLAAIIKKQHYLSDFDAKGIAKTLRYHYELMEREFPSPDPRAIEPPALPTLPTSEPVAVAQSGDDRPF